MPKELEQKLQKQAGEHSNWSEERKDAYVYGTLRKTGWKPSREKGHGSLNDITFHEEATEGCSEVFFDDVKPHPVHSGYSKNTNGADQDLDVNGGKGCVIFGSVEWEQLDLDGDPKLPGNSSALRDIGTGVHIGAPIDYFGPDTDYRAEEIDPHQYGKDYEPFPFRDFYKTEDKQWERGFRVREQDEYDSTPTPGAVTDSQPMVEAYGAVNHQGAGPERELPDNRSFESQRNYARSNKEKSAEYAVDISGLDTKMGKDIR